MTDLSKAVERLTDLADLMAGPMRIVPAIAVLEVYANSDLDKALHLAADIRALYAALSDQSAELAKARGALESIARNTCCGTCREAALVARRALGETK